MVSVDVANPTRVSETSVGNIVEVGPPEGDTEEARETVPPKPLRPSIRNRSAAMLFPCWMLMVLVWSVIVKSGPAPVGNIAVCTFSGTGGIAPLEIVTQSGGWLVGAAADPQPVWKTRKVPNGLAVTLYIA